MEIYLLRHAIAEDAKPRQPDSERALTEEGREKLRRVLKRARAAGVSPGLVLSSPLRRAIETAEEAAAALGYNGKIVRTAALAPDAAPPDVWNEIRARRDETAILLSSHEPLMSVTLAYLLGCPGLAVDMKKAALARVDTESYGTEPRCMLKWLLTPSVAGGAA